MLLRLLALLALLAPRGQRIRDVRQGADGALYIVTDEPRGELWKIVPGARPTRAPQGA